MGVDQSSTEVAPVVVTRKERGGEDRIEMKEVGVAEILDLPASVIIVRITSRRTKFI